MSVVKDIWSLLFRLFPCPTPTGIRAVGTPGPDSPVLVTCNFHGTVRRLDRALGRAGVDAWLLVADSKGVNVWCAAGAEEFSTRSVVAAVKTSGIAERVAHRHLILPPLGGPGIAAHRVAAETGWHVHWGPVRAADLPRYLAANRKRDEAMRRATYRLRERLDTALGSLFPFFLVGALVVLALWRGLLLHYLLVGAIAFLFFFATCLRLPTRRGITKALVCDAVLAVPLMLSYQPGWLPGGLHGVGAALGPLRVDLYFAMGFLLLYGSELGGLASTLPSDLDPLLARLGIGAIGNTAFAGTVRTELLNGYRVLTHDPERCTGCRSCVEICPLGLWEMGPEHRARHVHPERCTACRACLVQCADEAITAPRRPNPAT